MIEAFVPFGTAHLTVIALTVAVPLALAAFVHRGHRIRRTRLVGYGFAIAFIAGWACWIALLHQQGWLSWGNVLPMHLCDWANIAVLITLFNPNRKSYELAYFWTLGGTLPALLMPALAYGFPDPRFLIFMGFHGTIIGSVIFLTFGMGLRPHPASIRRTLLWSVFYVVAASTVNAALHTNYGFLAAKPPEHTPFDWLSPWPWYIPELAAAGTLLAFLWYAPWFVWDFVRRHSPHPPDLASDGTSAR